MTYELTKEDAIKINGKEIMVNLPDMDKPYHGVILSKEGVGTSVKPYFVDEKEKEEFIKLVINITYHDYPEYEYEDLYKKVENIIEEPTYCWMFSPVNTPFEDILFFIDHLEKGSIRSYEEEKKINLHGHPVCPF